MADYDRHYDPPSLAAHRDDYPQFEHREPRRRRREKRPPRGRPGRGSFYMALGGLATAAVIFAVSGGIGGHTFLPAAEPVAAPSPAAEASPAVADQPAAQLPAPPLAPLTAPPQHPIGLQAYEWGLSECLGQITQVAGFLTGNSVANWRLLRGAGEPDKELFAGTIIAEDKSNGLRGVSTLFAAPVTAGRCQSGFDLVIYFAESCEQASARKLPGFDTKVELGPVAEVWATNDGRGSVTFLPAGEAGCVMIRTGYSY